jgi:hypothetical protein
MSDFVGVVSDYIELESGRLPYTDDASLLRAFGGGGKRKGLEQEMIDAAPRGVPTAKKDAARQRASVQRQLQKWGLAGKARGKKGSCRSAHGYCCELSSCAGATHQRASSSLARSAGTQAAAGNATATTPL